MIWHIMCAGFFFNFLLLLFFFIKIFRYITSMEQNDLAHNVCRLFFIFYYYYYFF